MTADITINLNTYKLIYFNVRARAEPIRMLLHMNDVAFEDFRIERSDWPQWKDKMPYNQVPVLEVNGKPLAQSITICRYLARKFKMTGEDDFEAAQCDELVDAMMDLRADWRKWFWSELEQKEANFKQFTEVSAPKYLTKFDKIAKESDGECLLGKGKPYNWAAIFFACVSSFYEDTAGLNFLESYPNLKKHQQNVFNIPKIKEWIEKRPSNTM